MTNFRFLVAALLLLLNSIVFNTVIAQSSVKGLPLVTNFTTEQYKGGIQNWDISQGTNDLLYVANNFGLLIYDGVKWSTLWSALSIKAATRIISVACSSEDYIYLGGQGDFGFFKASPNGQLNYTSLKERLPAKYQNFNEVWKIYTIGKATYFFTFDYIFKLENDNIEVIDPNTTIGFGFELRNKLFVSIPQKGLMQLDGNTLSPYIQHSALMGKELRGMVPFNMNKTLIATRNNGIYVTDGTNVEIWDVPFNNWLKAAQINTIQLLSSNLYAIGTQNNGVLIADASGNVVYLLSKDRGLKNNTVLSLFEDRFGNLWAGLNNGIALIELKQPFTLINDNTELLGTGYTAIKVEDDFYLGTNNGLFQLEPNNGTSLFHPKFKRINGTEGQTYSLQIEGSNLLLGHHQGAFLIQNNNAIPIKNSVQGIWKIKEIPNDKDNLIAGTYNGMYHIEKKNNEWQITKKYQNFDESSRKFEIADDNTIWMSHGYKGVFRLKFIDNFSELESVKFYGEDNGFPSKRLINVFKIQNRLVFAAETGIYEYNPSVDAFELDTALSNYFGNQHIRELEEDILGNIYFITEQDVGVLKKNNLGNYEKEVATFKKIVPFVSDDLEDIIIIDQENILINAKEGFIQYSPNIENSAVEEFSTVFRQISWGDSLLYGGYNLQSNDGSLAKNKSIANLPYSKKAIHFSYASVYFEGTFNAEYQYYLENFDSDWSDWSLMTEKEYTNLPAGKYTFHVKSRNSLGKESLTTQYTFEILPPWYLSTFAYSIYYLLGLSSIVFGIVMIDRKYKKQQRNLMESTSKAIKEKEFELEEVTTQSEREIAQLKNEQLEAELRHKNKELASSAMHLINKNEFMNYLKLEISHLIKQGDKSTIEKGLKRIVKTIEKNIAEDEVWNQFEIHFDQVHGDFIKKLRERFPELTPQEVKISAFLRMNMSSKEIAQLLNISVRGVEISRYRLRKKLPIESSDNLIDFMMGIG